MLNELFARHLLTAEECSEMARKGRSEWEDCLAQVLSVKPAEVVQEACQVLQEAYQLQEHDYQVERLKSGLYYSSTN